MDELGKDTITELLADREPPCISLYQPTHRSHPDNRQDPIRYRNLVKSIERSLEQRYAAFDAADLLTRFRDLAEDTDFWNHTLDGLAVLGARNLFRVFRLQRPVPELAVVAASFHVKPLLRIVQSADRYQVLALSQDQVKLFEGNRDVLDEVELAPEVPRTLTDALGEDLTEPRLTVSSYRTGAGGPGAYHGHGGRKDQVDSDRERFFRVIDRAVLEHHSGPSGLPLILAALDEHNDEFPGVSRNPALMPEGVRVDPGAVGSEALRRRAWQVVEPDYHARFARLVEDFAAARSQGRGTDDLSDAARAGAAGRIATLLVEDGRHVAGRLDRQSGEIEPGDLADPEVDDLLDDLAELTIVRGGEVVVAPTEKMPTESGIAAIFRF